MSDDVKGREHLVRRQQVLCQQVFKRFAHHWPRVFAAAKWPDLLESWLDSLRGVDTEHLEPAVRDYLSKGASQYPPKPWEFAKYARIFQANRNGTVYREIAQGSPTDNERPFWYEVDFGDGNGVIRQQAWILQSGGCRGIADVHMQAIHEGRIAYGYGLAYAPADAIAAGGGA